MVKVTLKIKVRVFGDLAPILGKKQTIMLDEGATMRTLSNHIAKKVGLKRQGYFGKYKVAGGDLATLINGRHIDLLNGLSTVLKDGDEVVIFPPAPGG